MARQQAQVRGRLTYREGDGVEMVVPPGPCEVDVTELDATLSWTDGDTHGSTAIPLADYRRYLVEGQVVVAP